MRATLSRLLVVLTSVAAFGAVTAAPAAATPGDCPGGAEPCVYLPGGTYTLGNPVNRTAGVAPSTTTLLRHCDSTGSTCDELLLNLPGFTLTSTESAFLTLHVPGQGVSLDGTTPTLYLGLPEAGSQTQFRAGLTLTVSGSTFVLWDTAIDVAWACSKMVVPPILEGVSGHVGICSYSLTVSV